MIVIPGDDPPQIQGSPHLERLRRYGEVRLHTDRPATPEEKLARARDAVCLVNTRGAIKWPREALAALPRLRMATVCGIGTDSFDLVAAREQGIVVCNIPGKTAPIVAEHAFGLMLAVAKRAHFQTARLKAGRWGGLDNVYLHGKTLGVVGHRGDRRGDGPTGSRPSAWTSSPGRFTRSPRGQPSSVSATSRSTSSCGRPTWCRSTSGSRRRAADSSARASSG